MSYAEKSELKNAIWQYMIDHSQIQDNGYYGVQLYFKDRDDFFKRITARGMGFKRYEEEQKEFISLKKQNIYQTYLVSRKKSERMDKRIKEIQNGRNILDKFLWFVQRKCKRYLFKGI